MDAEVLSLMVTAVATALKEFLQDTHYRSQPLSATRPQGLLLLHSLLMDLHGSVVSC